jgi:hypothetical protein
LFFTSNFQHNLQWQQPRPQLTLRAVDMEFNYGHLAEYKVHGPRIV